MTRWKPGKPVGHYVLYPYKGRKVRNIIVAGYLYEVGSLPSPLEDHGTTITDNTARNKESVIWPAKLHSSNLFEPRIELVSELEFPVPTESKDRDRVSPCVVVCTDVTVRGVDQGGGERSIWLGN